MTDFSPESPLEEGRAALERHLSIQMSRDPQSVGLGGVVPYVAVLGVTDMLTAPPPVPAGGGDVIFPIHLYGQSAILGPASDVHAPDPPCFHCVALRWQKVRPGPERDVLELGGHPVRVDSAPFVTPFALEAIWQLFAQLAASSSAGRWERTAHGFPFIYELRLDSLKLRRFPVIGDPACPVCARPRPDTAEGADIELVSRLKRDLGEYRLRHVRDYNLPFEAFANPVCGMLGVAGMPDLTSSTTAPVTGYIFVRGSAPKLFDFFWSGHADVYDDSASLAVLEGLERYAGLQRRSIGAPLVACLREIEPHALDPRECGVYTDEFYETAGPFFTKFTPELRMPWVWGYSLRDSRPVLVPERIVYYLGEGDSANFVQECSNGCAIGSSLEEAILYGMLELIERDAFLLGWHGAARLPEIDPDTCGQATRFMIDRISMDGYDVRLFDNRIDLPIPVVTAVALRRDGGLGALSLASGASFDPQDAVRGALCEIGSYVTDFEQRMMTSLDRVKPMVTDFDRVTGLHDHPLVFGLPEMARHADFLLGERRSQPMSEIYRDWETKRPQTLDLLDDLRYCQDILTGAGFDVIVVDQTSPEQEAVGLHTACVIVPGLIPIDFGWRNQRVLHMPRMRTAFRRAGWRDTDLEPSELHMVPHPFP